MYGPMRWGGGRPMGHGGGGYQMDIPLIPAPAALCAMLVGLMIGVMIGRKKSMMHGMGPGMMHVRGSWSDCAARKKMMGEVFEHHHHGDGMPGCGCGHGSSSVDVGATDE